MNYLLIGAGILLVLAGIVGENRKTETESSAICLSGWQEEGRTGFCIFPRGHTGPCRDRNGKEWDIPRKE